MRHKILLAALLFGTISASCHKEEDDNETEKDTIVVEKTIRSSEVTLYNQYSSNGKFYKIADDEVHSDSTKDFDLMFLYPDKFNAKRRDKIKYMLASPASSELHEELWKSGMEYKQDDENDLKFYALPATFKSYMFDSLSSLSALRAIEKSCSYYFNENSKSDSFYSDGYGWATRDMFAFKVNNRFGLAQIKSISPYKEEKEGFIVLKVKIEED